MTNSRMAGDVLESAGSAGHRAGLRHAAAVKLALHRSISFWAGMLVMGFVAWAWWDSLWNEATCLSPPLFCGQHYGGCFVEMAPSVAPSPSPRVYGTARRRIIYHQQSWLEKHLPSFLFPKPDPSPFGTARGLAAESGRLQLLPPPSFLRGAGRPFSELDPSLIEEVPTTFHIDETRFTMQYRGVGDWYLFVPYWLILALLAAVWTGLLMWRARRRRRVTAFQAKAEVLGESSP